MSEEIQRLFIEAKKEIEMPKEELLEKLWDLQQRVSDAIEYIEENQYQHEWTDRCGFTCRDDRYILNDSQDLLEILKGDR